AAVNYKKLKSENFAEITDMLGSTVGYLNVDSFDGYQFDMQNPDQLVGEGDKIRYNYNLHSDVVSGFAQAQFKYNKVDFYLGGSVTSTSYQREGVFQHERYPDSYGDNDKLTFTGVGAKGGFTYKITGKHLIDVNAGYLSKAPTIRNSYSNSRENDAVVKGISEEKVTSVDASYIFRSPIVKAKLTGFFTKIQDANEVSFYYADGIVGYEDVSGTDTGDEVTTTSTSAFVQEILAGVDKKH